MSIFPILAASFIISVISVLFVICSVVLILIVLIQKGKGGGLSGAFGGGMVGGVLGTKVGDVLTWVTIVTAVVFIVLAVVLGKWLRPSVGEYGAGQVQQQTTAGQPAPEVVPAETDSNSESNLPVVY